MGENLQDHVAALVGPFAINNPPKTDESLTYLPIRDSRPFNVLEYLSSGRGPLTQSGSMASGFVALDRTNESQPIWPDSQLLLIAIPIDDDGLQTLTKTFNVEPAIANEYYSSVVNQDSFNILAVVARPKSRGSIKLASNNPFDNPLIDPNYFSHPDDMKIALKVISKTLELVENTKAFSRIGAKLVTTPFPTCKHLKYRSDEYWECFAREYTVTVNHPCGTCAMGKIEDANSVVDSSLKVKGVTGLRVIDASIMPQIVTTNINPACTLIAERGAQMILDEYLSRSR